MLLTIHDDLENKLQSPRLSNQAKHFTIELVNTNSGEFRGHDSDLPAVVGEVINFQIALQLSLFLIWIFSF